jgi:hypothetical protein
MAIAGPRPAAVGTGTRRARQRRRGVGATALAAALPTARLRRLDVRRTDVGGRGARALVDALDGHPTMEFLGINGGVPRRQRRRASTMLAQRPAAGPHPDVRAIASVYR